MSSPNVSIHPPDATWRRTGRALLVAGTLLLVVGLGTSAYVRSRAHARSAAALSVVSPDDLRTLVDHDGAPFSFARLHHKTVVMSFIFTHCPSSCPLQTRALAAVERALPPRLADRVQFVSVTMDPQRDTPAVLKQYATALGADLARWSFVTGAGGEVEWLHRHFDARVKPLGGGQFDHRVAVYLIGADGRLMQTYAGDFDPARVGREIDELDRLVNRS